LNKVEDEAAAGRQRLLDEARKESDTLRTKWQEALRSEHQSLSEELTRRTREEVFAIARKTLTDLATTTLEGEMTDAFVRRLRELSSEEKGALQSVFEAASTPAIIRSTFDLPSAQRTAIEGVVKEVLAIETQVQFETAPDLVSGIEVTANGHKIAWSIGNYLASLKKSVDDLLNARPKQTAKAAEHPEQLAHKHGT
jgi:F-type H+-transporting ATPase subunit b